MKTLLHTLFFFLLVTQICFGQWYQQNSGTTATLNSVHFEDANNGWAVGDSGIILHTTNSGQEWLKQNSGTNNHLNGGWFADLNTGWVVGDSGTILKTSNGGQEWITQTSGTNLYLYSACFIDVNKGWIAAGGYHDGIGGYGAIILHTTNGGTDWVTQYVDTVSGACLNAVYFVDNSMGWAVGRNATLLKTTDGGDNWINPSAEFNWDFAWSVYFLDLNNGWAAVAGIPKVCGDLLYTTNGGVDWFDGGDATTYSIYFIDSNNGWAVGHSSMCGGSNTHKSNDGGRNWINQAELPGESLNSVYFTDINNGWIVGDNGTILHTTNGGVTFVEEEQIDEVPTTYSLSNNFPNPFNPSTKIKYSIPKSSQVVVKVFDVLGNEIETIVNEEKSVGTYELNWNAANLPSGVYFYRLQAGDFVQTRKMILLK